MIIMIIDYTFIEVDYTFVKKDRVYNTYIWSSGNIHDVINDEKN